ncbi:protein phosphatase 4, regulatory subunit 2 [Blastocladiella emersonii ATCC 22665]|nr:protein phosphatase 4, regulatory subunit 2 [Blastocladiella emersonii ATCC 22665]
MTDVALVSREEVEAFCKLKEDERKWEPHFEPVLMHTAQCAELLFPWQLTRELIKARIIEVVTRLNTDAESRGAAPDKAVVNAQLRVLGRHFDALTSAPFTTQRLCEIAMVPQQADLLKYLRAVEKVVCVSTTSLPPAPVVGEAAAQAAEEDEPMMLDSQTPTPTPTSVNAGIPPPPVLVMPVPAAVTAASEAVAAGIATSMPPRSATLEVTDATDAV